MTKDQIVAILINSNDYVSGEKISNELGISRAAVNSAVKSLRQDGYQIDSSTNKGYLLTSIPDLLSSGQIEAVLGSERMKTVHVVDSIDSTNKKVKELGMHGAPSGTIVIANEQTGGRGRLGRTFLSPPDVGFYISVLLRPTNTALSDISTITAWSSVAIANAIKASTGVTPGIKWVNDLVINKHKICGILTELSIETESSSIEYVVIGIGLNINNKTTDFPEELRDIASSISAETDGKLYNRSVIAAELIKELDKLGANWPDGKDKYLQMYRELSVTNGQLVTVIPSASHDMSQARNGKAIAINDDFSLKVEFEDGHTEDLSSGEVSVRGLYGYT